MDKTPKYDLEERTAIFAEKIILMLRSIKIDTINRRVADQLIGASGSLAANYYEAVEAESKKDFTHKIGICRKETKEVKLWLRLLLKTNPEKTAEAEEYAKEAHELLLIFSKIVRSSRGEN
ncbi:MAG: four helix bundle protein [Parcubacteria group bacterium CG11_big_fil_rev_8_21_14_0_20_39_22]|nr:MAG: four helix bundle protein [Parcubacteria group bacterium CG11_big_fil_rev_8_21_14_0_20_39_22]